MHENFTMVNWTDKKIENIFDYVEKYTLFKCKELYPEDVFKRNSVCNNIKIKVSSRYRKLYATCSKENCEIVYNSNWLCAHEDHPDFKAEVDDTVIHEVAHLEECSHSNKWKEVVKRLGGYPSRVVKTPLCPPPLYRAVCRHCNTEFFKYSKPRTMRMCKMCWDEGYHSESGLLYQKVE